MKLCQLQSVGDFWHLEGTHVFPSLVDEPNQIRLLHQYSSENQSCRTHYQYHQALKLQRPLPDGGLEIGALGEKMDEADFI